MNKYSSQAGSNEPGALSKHLQFSGMGCFGPNSNIYGNCLAAPHLRPFGHSHIANYASNVPMNEYEAHLNSYGSVFYQLSGGNYTRYTS